MRMVLFVIVMLLGISLSYAQVDEQAGAEVKKQETNIEETGHLYQWTDQKGIVHISDGLGKVPKKFRDKARRVESRKGEAGPSLTPELGAGEMSDADQKAVWQKRMKDARQKLADAQERYRQLEEKRNTLTTSWGGVGSGRLAERAEADRIEQEMKGVQQEIDDARNQVDVVIPDEARREGVPPGWLRE